MMDGREWPREQEEALRRGLAFEPRAPGPAARSSPVSWPSARTPIASLWTRPSSSRSRPPRSSRRGRNTGGCSPWPTSISTNLQSGHSGRREVVEAPAGGGPGLRPARHGHGPVAAGASRRRQELVRPGARPDGSKSGRRSGRRASTWSEARGVLRPILVAEHLTPGHSDRHRGDYDLHLLQRRSRRVRPGLPVREPQLCISNAPTGWPATLALDLGDPPDPRTTV